MARLLQGGEVVALKGDLGAGKTQFVKGLAQGLGAATREVASPTFVFIHEYRGRLPLAHIDLYRIEASEELDQLGWADYLDGRWVVAVEWPEKAENRLPADRVEIQLQHRTPRTREATCTAFGPAAQAVVRRLRRDAPLDIPPRSRARRRS
ncbi:tRNA (adenosine(37)-N6)-threonylcarbamoyltransferase complex ATPase subunit type 1 TsaE [Nitrospira sp.]|nr:tRNA (adenosine(37)-N6)-threonylcarbamoyltransferase complex ATPase subunit type 1 TsaE [Nitrospira sp.]